MTQRKAFSARGFGLAEILVAIVLFVTAFSFLLQAITAATYATRQAQDQSVAQDLAEKIQEQQRNLPFASITSFNDTANVTYRNNGTQVVTTFIYAVTVTNMTVTPGPALTPPVLTKVTDPAFTSQINLKDILVKVQWTSDNVSRSATLESAVGK